MSFDLTAAGIESNLGPHPRLVFIALAHCANNQTSYCRETDTWKAWPSIDRIVQYTGLSASSVRRALKSLATSGLVQISRRRLSRHRNLTNIYTLSRPENFNNDNRACIAEEVTPAEIRPISTERDDRRSEGVCPTASPPREAVTQAQEGVTQTPKQRTETNKEKFFDARIPPNSVAPDVWTAYLALLIRLGRRIPDRHQHEAQGEFLAGFDALTQRAIVHHSVRQGWPSLHPPPPLSTNVRAFSKPEKNKPEKKPVFERLTDTAWADGLRA